MSPLIGFYVILRSIERHFVEGSNVRVLHLGVTMIGWRNMFIDTVVLEDTGIIKFAMAVLDKAALAHF